MFKPKFINNTEQKKMFFFTHFQHSNAYTQRKEKKEKKKHINEIVWKIERKIINKFVLNEDS